MVTGSDKLVALRRLLDERHPPTRPRTSRIIATGIPALDQVLGGGLRTGALTEFVSESPSSGSQTSLGALLLATRLSRQRVALVDAANAFDPEGLDPDVITHVVWTRCASLTECWKAADLVARDPNFAVVVIDVRGQSLRDLMRTRDSVWARLKHAAERAETAVVVQSDSAIVPNATIRVVFAEPLSAAALMAPRREITIRLTPALQRMRLRNQEGVG